MKNSRPASRGLENMGSDNTGSGGKHGVWCEKHAG